MNKSNREPSGLTLILSTDAWKLLSVPLFALRQMFSQINLLRLCVGESVMTSLHWVELRFLVPPPPTAAEPVESRCRAISSVMKVFRSTSWSPFRLLRHTGPEPEELPPLALPVLPLLPLTCVGEPGAPERTLMLAMAPLRPEKGWEDQMERRKKPN